MTNKFVVGSDQKPNVEQLLEMYKKLDSQMKEIMAQYRRGALNDRHIQALIEHRNPFPKKEVDGDVFPVTVNYDLSVESLVAHGKYDLKNDSINSKNFQTERKGTQTITLEPVHLNQTLTSEEVLKELEKRGLRPAELHELLSFGIQYPNEQRNYPIMALASVWRDWWRGSQHVAFLNGSGDKRGLYLGWLGGRWYEGCRFLAVRES